jgi:hypothetical protein
MRSHCRGSARTFPVLITNEGEELAQKRYVSVVLRLAVDRRGHLVYGEIVDMAGKPNGRFQGWRGLTQAVKTWLSSQGQRSLWQ